jgi:hypothetical protein
LYFEFLVLGGALTDLGEHPSGPLAYLVLSIFVFYWPYLFAVFSGGERGGLWKEQPDDKPVDLAHKQAHELVVYDDKWKTRKFGLLAVVGIPLYFSLTSALYFAWLPIVIGTRSISAQLRKYILRCVRCRFARQCITMLD